MNRTRWLALGGVLVVAAFAWWWASTHRGPEKVKYRTAAIERGGIEMVVSATGTVQPVEQVEVGSQVSGTVNRLDADYNSRVRKGQILLQLDPSSFRARFQQAEASVARAEASLRDAKRGYARAQELVKDDYISEADVETAEVTVEQREADLKQANAALQSARVDLDNTTIRSPIDGVVIARAVELGQTVAASLQSPRLFVIANDLTNMQVETRIDEADIGQIRPGLPVMFTVDAFPDQSFEGRVSQVRLEPITEQNVVTYTTVIATRNPDLRLRPGMTANVTVQVADREDVLKLPNAALRFRPPAEPGGGRSVASAQTVGGATRSAGGAGAAGGARGAGGRRAEGTRGASDNTKRTGSALPASGPVVMGTSAAPQPRPATVYVLRDGRPEAVKVTTGLSDGGFTEIVSGELKPGDVVIVGTESNGSRTTTSNVQLPPGMGGGGGGRGGR